MYKIIFLEIDFKSVDTTHILPANQSSSISLKSNFSFFDQY